MNVMDVYKRIFSLFGLAILLIPLAVAAVPIPLQFTRMKNHMDGGLRPLSTVIKI